MTDSNKELVWDTLWKRRSIGRIAVGVAPGPEAHERSRTAAAEFPIDRAVLDRPPHGDARWKKAVQDGIAAIFAVRSMPGDGFAALGIPRFVHGQSQGLCDLFGARVEPQEDGNYFVHPLPSDPQALARLKVRPLEQSLYWGAVEYAGYARAATAGAFPIRNPVMTGPLDTANYLLGSTVLFEWVHREPHAVHDLLDLISDVLIRFIHALQAAAGGTLQSDTFCCMRGGFSLCSECRSIVSREVFATFEAPRLRRIGEACGPYGIHSCGSWERTVPEVLADPNLRAMHGQIRENDLAELCRLADGRMTFAIGPSINLHERFTWNRKEDFYTHILRTVPRTQPCEVAVPEDEIALWNRLCDELGIEHNRISVEM